MADVGFFCPECDVNYDTTFEYPNTFLLEKLKKDLNISHTLVPFNPTQFHIEDHQIDNIQAMSNAMRLEEILFS